MWLFCAAAMQQLWWCSKINIFHTKSLQRSQDPAELESLGIRIAKSHSTYIDSDTVVLPRPDADNRKAALPEQSKQTPAPTVKSQDTVSAGGIAVLHPFLPVATLLPLPCSPHSQEPSLERPGWHRALHYPRAVYRAPLTWAAGVWNANQASIHFCQCQLLSSWFYRCPLLWGFKFAASVKL